MQQATSPIAQLPPSGNIFAPPPASPRFVVNLCSSTTPVALVQPTHAGLKRFTFFVSRRLEEGRERFRLHMGYFESQEEAEKILDLVRDVYPAAWAGVAPGIKLRARAAQAPAQEAAHAALPLAAVPVAEPSAAAPIAAAESPAATPAPQAVVSEAAAPQAAAAEAAAPEAALPEAAAPAAAPESSLPAAPAEPAVAAAPPSLRLALSPDLPRVSRAKPVDDATRSLVDVRAAIKSLDDTAPRSTDAVLEGEAVLQLLTASRPAPAARVAPVSPQPQPSPPASRPAVDAPPADVAAPAPSARAVVRDDPAVRTEASSAGAAGRAEPALFAVQLLWSVQPIDMNQVPLLAIFSAYTLYGAEGNRDGRRWYGLRLGFFTDAVSAKQVAQYVRSEFRSVSVVPVSERERGRANKATARPLPQNSRREDAGPELKFIDDVQTDTAASGNQPALTEPPPPPVLRAADSPAAQAAIAAVGLTARPTPGKRVKARNAAPAGKGQAKRPRPMSLEETLEILGAGDLSLEKSRGELMNDQSRRDRKPAAQGTSKFGRLINRLAERLGNG
jgi:hypothetical protein